MAIATKRRNGKVASTAQSLDRARARIAKRVNLPDPPRQFETEDPAITLARATVELAAILEAAAR